MVSQPAYRIVVADDNHEAADALAVILAFSNYEVRVAYGGLEAVELVNGFEPAAALLDIGMPGMDGYQAARAIRRSRLGDRIVLIALTARKSLADLRAAQAAGFDVHVAKPVAGDDLVNLLNDSLRRVKGWQSA